jgi:ribosomal protein L21E
VGQKNTFFEKQTGEVIENKGNAYITSQKQTEKQTGEVVEKIRGLKKQS